MRVKVLTEAGYEAALFGCGLSHGVTSGMDFKADFKPYIHEVDGDVLDVLCTKEFTRMERVTKKLAHMDGGHNKFLESIIVWLDVTAPRGWWQEADTYRLTSKQSESTMHTITKRPLTHDDFHAGQITDSHLHFLNHLISEENWESVKLHLPESFLQRRIWRVDYKTLRNILLQRWNHRWKLWREFCEAVLEQVGYPELLPSFPNNQEKEKRRK